MRNNYKYTDMLQTLVWNFANSALNNIKQKQITSTVSIKDSMSLDETIIVKNYH